MFSDYQEYLYAGNMEITEDMSENQRGDVASDMSHFRRMPLFLTSYILLAVDVNWLQTTFMDGTNVSFNAQFSLVNTNEYHQWLYIF